MLKITTFFFLFLETDIFFFFNFLNFMCGGIFCTNKCWAHELQAYSSVIDIMILHQLVLIGAPHDCVAFSVLL